MEQTITILIYIHAFFGGLGLITGIASILVKKGSLPHKNMGKLFSVGMITSSVISIPITFMPNHENLFLLLIAVFTIYLVLTGRRALIFKTTFKVNTYDKVLSGSMFLFAIIMLFLAVFKLINTTTFGVLYLFFGGFGLLLVYGDFKFYKQITHQGNAWLIVHIKKMIGALIASITAFIVAGVGVSTLTTWMLPTIFGTIYIIYWKRKVIKNQVMKNQ